MRSAGHAEVIVTFNERHWRFEGDGLTIEVRPAQARPRPPGRQSGPRRRSGRTGRTRSAASFALEGREGRRRYPDVISTLFALADAGAWTTRAVGSSMRGVTMASMSSSAALSTTRRHGVDVLGKATRCRGTSAAHSRHCAASRRCRPARLSRPPARTPVGDLGAPSPRSARPAAPSRPAG